MDQGTLVREQIDAGSRFLHEFEKFTLVVAAFWLKERENNQWNLYVASDRFNKGENIQGGYGEALQIVRDMHDPNFEPFRLKLVGLHEPTVQAALESYKGRPPKIPLRIPERIFGNVDAEGVYLLKGPTGKYTMPSGREVLDQIIDQEASFYEQHGRPPRKMKLPVLMAYDLAKCGRDELGDVSWRVFKDGITAFEKEGVHGMAVELVRDRNAALEFE